MRSRLFLPALLLALALPTLPARAVEPPRQDLTALQKAVEKFIRGQTTGLPGTVEVTVAAFDPRLSLPACRSPEPFIPAGSRPWGNTTVGVRCAAPSPWIIYVPVIVKVMGNVVVTARPLVQGTMITQADLASQRADLTQLPAGVISDPAQALGKTLVFGVGAGQPLRRDLLKSPPVVLQGQTVKLVARGPGFAVSSEGRALNNAGEDQVAQVRIAGGQVISGIARRGAVVEVPY